MKKFILLGWVMLCFQLTDSLAQKPKPSKKEQSEIEQQSKEAQEEWKKINNPANINQLFDQQLKELKEAGILTSELKQEIEKARAEMLQAAKNQSFDKTQPTPSGAVASNDNNLNLLETKQELPDIFDEIPSPYSKVPTSFRFYKESKVTAESFSVFMKNKFGVNLKHTNTDTDPGGSSLWVFQQYFDNYPIYGAVYKLFIDSKGRLMSASGDAFDDSLNPANKKIVVGEDKALQTVKQSASAAAKGVPIYEHLVIIPDYLNPYTKKFRLTHQIKYNQRRYFVDVTDGKIAFSEKLIVECFHPAQTNLETPKAKVTTTYYGVQEIETHYDKVKKNYAFYSSPDPFILVLDTTGIFEKMTNTGWDTPYFRNNGLLDAAFSGQKTVEYFKSKFGRNSFDNKGTQLSIFRMYGDGPKGYPNAYWSGEDSLIVFGAFGKNPLSTLDIIGHEFTHGVAQYTANLVGSNQSGAINEALADMLGTAIEFSTLGPAANWVIGSEAKVGGVRNLKSPKSKSHPNTYEGIYWMNTLGCLPDSTNDDCGEHVNSTVAGHWFYLLCEGGKGTNDHEQTYNIAKGIGIEKAAKLVYRTMLRLTPYTGFERFADATVAASEQLFGKCADETYRVKQAWHAVGVYDDAPARCNNYTFDMTSTEAPEIKIRFYVKGDSIVAITRNEEGWAKSFSERHSAIINFVVKNEEGINTVSTPKNWTKNMLAKLEETQPMADMMTDKALDDARKELRDPTTSAERRAELQQVIPLVEKNIKEGKKYADELKQNLNVVANENPGQTETQFWGDTKTKRKFDKDHIKGTYLYEGKYLAKRYEIGGGMNWVSTTEIPLRFSDLLPFVPLATTSLRPGVDHFMRGFPLKMAGGFVIKNIKESIPANFETLFSMSSVID